MAETSEALYRGNRKYAAVPAGIGLILGVIALICLTDPVTSTSSLSGGESSDISVFGGLGIFLGLMSFGAFKVLDSTYVDAVTVNKDGFVVKRILRSPAVHNWKRVKKVFADDHSLCVQFEGGENMDFNGCLENFASFAESMKRLHKAAKTD